MDLSGRQLQVGQKVRAANEGSIFYVPLLLGLLQCCDVSDGIHAHVYQLDLPCTHTKIWFAKKLPSLGAPKLPRMKPGSGQTPKQTFDP